MVDEYSLFVSKSVLWDYFKLRVKQFRITYGIIEAKMHNDTCKNLEVKLKDLDHKIHSNCSELIQERKRIKDQLDEMYTKKSKGYQFRAWAKYAKQGEKSTQYFLGLEKKRQNSNCIDCLKDGNGNYVYTDNDILDRVKQLCSELYTANDSNDEVMNAYLDTITPEKQLDEDTMLKCEGIFTVNECKLAISNMKKNKSPGLDGISVEFYEAFWPVIGDLLVSVFNDCYERESLPKSQWISVFSLIFKNDDACDLAKYRPISLTNTDYRIMAFTLAARLQLVIGIITLYCFTLYFKITACHFMGVSYGIIQMNQCWRQFL